jgi:hypothetical protein
MRPAPVLAALGLLWASEGHAACRHYSRWYYPWPQPQHCGVAHVQQANVRARTLPPVLDEAATRAQAIERLKTILGRE